MSPESPRGVGPITQLLDAVGRGDRTAHERLWALAYEELRRVAHNQMAGDRRHLGLQTTILVHEAYLRLVGDRHPDVHWENRRHFFAAAAKAMRRIRIDDARTRARRKRGGPGMAGKRRRLAGRNRHEGPEPGSHEGEDQSPERKRRVGSVEAAAFYDVDPLELLALDEALTKLEQKDPRKAEIVTLRYFAGLTIDETAAALGASPRYVDQEWRFARACLHRALAGE